MNICPTGLLSTRALWLATHCRGAGQELNSIRLSLSWKLTWASHGSVSEDFHAEFDSELCRWTRVVCVWQFCVWGTQWRRWRRPREPSTCLTACWDSASLSATSTEPCTSPVTTSCGLEKQGSSPNWTRTNGASGPSGMFSVSHWTTRFSPDPVCHPSWIKKTCFSI